MSELQDVLSERDKAALAKARAKEAALLQKARAKTRRLQEAKKKKDTRKKIILGAVLFDLAIKGDPDARKMYYKIIDHVSDRDKHLFAVKKSGS